MAPTFVIVGASMAGAFAAATLRQEGFDGTVLLVGAEPHLPYERPSLSKSYVALNRGKEIRRAMPLIASRKAVDVEALQSEERDLRSFGR